MSVGAMDVREVAERRRADVRVSLREAESLCETLREELRRLDVFLDGRTYDEEHGLRGAALGRAAREVLRAKGQMHYRDVFDDVAAQQEIGGRDPLATFLTAVTRDPYIVRVVRGTYAAVDLEAAAA